MGPYLAKPETKIHTANSENDRFVYCTAEMQGWRKTQEDAHTALLDYDDKGSAFFAVFDGHGGDEVSKYCALHLPAFIKSSKLYDDKILESLKNSFLEFDRTLKEPDVINELRKLASADEIEDIGEDETEILKKEAKLPLEQIIQGSLSEIFQKKTNNGESSKNANKETNDESESNAVSSSSDEKKEKNGETSEDSNHIKKDKNSILFEQQKIEASSSVISSIRAGKSHALKTLHKQIYEAFLQDFDSDDEDEEDDANEEFENEENSSDNEDDDDEDDEDDGDDEEENEDEEEDSDYDNKEKHDISLGSTVYITPGGGSGCTAIVALVRNNTLYVANVGDSRCVLSRDGVAIDMSEDHKPEDELEKARIIHAGGEVTADGRVNGGLNLSRAIGDHLYKKNENLSDEEQMVTALPDIKTHELDSEKDQFIFIACDGIWNSMSSQEAVDFINERMKQNMPLKTICEELFIACLAPNTDGDGSGCDNMTCILIKLKKSTDPKRMLEEDPSDDHSEASVSKKAKTSNETDLYKPGTSKA